MRNFLMLLFGLFVLSLCVSDPASSEEKSVKQPAKVVKPIGSSMPVMNVPQLDNPVEFPTVQDTSLPIFDSFVNRTPQAPAVCGPGQNCGQRGFTPRADRISTPLRGRFFNGRVRGFFSRFGCRGC